MFELEIAKALAKIAPLAEGKGRVVIGIAGPPAAGKSTFSELLLSAICTELEPETVLVPMDGFHLDNRLLEERDILPRKGAPFTFDAAGFVSLIQRIKAEDGEVYYPVFDRSRDLAIAGAGCVKPQSKIILVEGNYLFLDEQPWRNIRGLFDLSIFLSSPKEVLEARLVQRWLDNGLSAEAASARALQNDIPNAHYVLAHSAVCDLNFS